MRLASNVNALLLNGKLWLQKKFIKKKLKRIIGS